MSAAQKTDAQTGKPGVSFGSDLAGCDNYACRFYRETLSRPSRDYLVPFGRVIILGLGAG